MKRIIAKFEYDTYIITVPDKIADYHKKYQKAFDKWLMNGGLQAKNNSKILWYNVEDFVNYLNIYHIKSEEKAFISEYDVKENLSDLPILYF